MTAARHIATAVTQPVYPSLPTCLKCVAAMGRITQLHVMLLSQPVGNKEASPSGSDTRVQVRHSVPQPVLLWQLFHFSICFPLDEEGSKICELGLRSPTSEGVHKTEKGKEKKTSSKIYSWLGSRLTYHRVWNVVRDSKMSRRMRRGPLAWPAGFRETGSEIYVFQSISMCGRRQKTTHLGNGRRFFEAVFCILFRTNSLIFYCQYIFYKDGQIANRS